MPARQKIATCCYCGTRAALVLCGTKNHELACARCGAPLHDLKQLPMPAAAPAPKKTRSKPGNVARAKPVYDNPKPKKKKKKRSVVKWLWEEIKDEIEDKIEDIFD